MQRSDSRVALTLKSAPLFAALSGQEMKFLAARAALRTYSPGQTLFSEGDPCSGLFVVASGRVRIFKTSPNGREQVLAVDGPGGSIAELPVFDGGPYPASAAAIETAEVVFVSRADFQAICIEHPQVSLKVLQVAGERLRRLVGIIEELSFTTVRQRLISWLVRKAKEDGTVIPITGGHQEIAAEIGTVRELVSRNLTRLQAEGLIELEGRRILIGSLLALEEELSAPGD